MAPPLKAAGAASKKAAEAEDFPALPAPHLQPVEGEPAKPDFVLCIPSYNRPRMLVERTMALVVRQRLPLQRVFVFIAGEPPSEGQEDQRTLYLKELVPLGLPEENVITGVRGIMHQRNFIINWILERFGPRQHVLSMDDDLEALCYKVRTGFDHLGGERGELRELEPGGLEAWIAHAERAMELTGAHLWSVSTSMNAYFMRTDVISTGSGLCNGYFYGFLARPDKALQPCFMAATEDCERSVRYWKQDGVVLRYKMYTARTKCFKNLGGLQDSYEGTIAERNERRKADEREGHKMIRDEFPDLYTAGAEKHKKSVQTMEGGFRRLRTSDQRFVNGLLPCLKPRRRGEGRPTIRAAARSAKALAGGPKDAASSAGSTASPSTGSTASPSTSSTATPSAASSGSAAAPAAAGSAAESPTQTGSSSSSAKASVRSRGGKAAARKDTAVPVELEGPPRVDDARGGARSTTASPPHFAAATSAPGPIVVDLEEEGWPCGTCTFNNVNVDVECAMCGAARPPDWNSWACSFCSSRNPALALACLLCEQVRKVEGSWECMRCWACSPADDPTCVGCGLSRGENHKGGFVDYIDSDSDAASESEESAPPVSLKKAGPTAPARAPEEPSHAAKRPRCTDANSAEGDGCQPWACEALPVGAGLPRTGAPGAAVRRRVCGKQPAPPAEPAPSGGGAAGPPVAPGAGEVRRRRVRFG